MEAAQKPQSFWFIATASKWAAPRVRCKYAFHHPKKDRIDMEMFYKDMVQSSCDDKKRAFVFKIGRQLGSENV
eukprot:753289-Hanusia_phi.AAC.3